MAFIVMETQMRAEVGGLNWEGKEEKKGRKINTKVKWKYATVEVSPNIHI